MGWRRKGGSGASERNRELEKDSPCPCPVAFLGLKGGQGVTAVSSLTTLRARGRFLHLLGGSSYGSKGD